MNLRDLTGYIDGTRGRVADALCTNDTMETLAMFGLGLDDLIYTTLGIAGLALLTGLAIRSKRICDQVKRLADTCQRHHQDTSDSE